MCIKCWCGKMESSNINCLSSINSTSTSILNANSNLPSFYIKSPLANLNYSLSTHLPPSSPKSTGHLTQNVLQIAWFLSKCLQAPLAPLAAFSRSATRSNADQFDHTSIYLFQTHFAAVLQTNYIMGVSVIVHSYKNTEVGLGIWQSPPYINNKAILD